MPRGVRTDPVVRGQVKLELQKGTSYRRIAKAFGVSYGLVAKCKKELSFKSSTTLKLMARAFNLSL